MAKKISGSVGKGGKNKPLDNTGQVTFNDSLSTDLGNPAPSAGLIFSAPGSSTPQTVGIAYPIGEDFEFFYNPAELGPVESLDYQLDLLALKVEGTPEVNISLALLQGETFLALPTQDTPSVDGTEGDWVVISQLGLKENDFTPALGGNRTPDFTQPFEFGYLFTADYAAEPLEVQLQLDNMQATINIIPEPLAFASALLLGLPLFCKRHRRR